MLNSFQREVADYLGFDPNGVEQGRLYSIRCRLPDHNDSSPSAYVKFDTTGNGVYGCHGCNRIVSLKGFMHFVKDGIPIAIDSTKVTLVAKEKRVATVSDHLLVALERFIEEKGIGIDTISRLGGFVDKNGYLTFEYGDGLWVARRLLPSDEDHPRYQNSLGEKGLLGQENIKKYEEIILVESVTDWLSLRQYNYENVVCSFGASLTDRQAYLLRGKTVFVVFHTDFEGYTGTYEKDIGAVDKIRKYKGVPIPIEIYQKDGIDEKQDINYHLCHDAEFFIVWFADILARYSASSVTYYRKKYFKSENLRYFNSPIQELAFTVGLHSITGKSGIGKTTLSLALLRYFANQGAKVLYMNGELPHEQIFARIQSYDSKFSWTEIERDCNIVEESVRQKTDVLLQKVNITGLLTIEEIFYAKKYYDVFIIDYLQKIKSKEKDERIRIDGHLEYLTTMVNDYGKIIICINRMPVSAYDKDTGHMFQGSGQIEFSSQQCIKLAKADYVDIMSLTVTKNTRGPLINKLFKIDYPHQKIIPASVMRSNEN